MYGTRSRVGHPTSSARHERRISAHRRNQGRASRRLQEADADDEDDEPTTPKQHTRAFSELRRTETPKSHRRTRSSTVKVRPDLDSILATPAGPRLRVRKSLAGPFLQETTVAERANITSILAKDCIISFLKAGLTEDIGRNGVSQHCMTAWESLQTQRRNLLFVDNHMPFSYIADVLQSLHKDVRGRIDTVPLEQANSLCNLAAYIRIIVDPDHATDIIDSNDPAAALKRNSPSRKGKEKALPAEALRLHVKNRDRILLMAWKHFWTIVVPIEMRSNEKAIEMWLEFSTQILLSFSTLSIDDWLETDDTLMPPPDEDLVIALFAPSAIARRGQWAGSENGGTPGPGGANWELGLAQAHWTNIASRRQKKLVEMREEVLARKYRYAAFRDQILRFIDDEVLPVLFGQIVSPSKPILPELVEDDGTETASRATHDTSTSEDVPERPVLPLMNESLLPPPFEHMTLAGDDQPERLDEDIDSDLTSLPTDYDDEDRPNGREALAEAQDGSEPPQQEDELSIGLSLGGNDEVIDHDQLERVLEGMANESIGETPPRDTPRAPLPYNPASPKRKTVFSFVAHQMEATRMPWDSPGGGTPSPRKPGEPLFLPFQGSDRNLESPADRPARHAETVEEDLMPDSSQLGSPLHARSHRGASSAASQASETRSTRGLEQASRPILEQGEDLMPSSSQLGSPIRARSQSIRSSRSRSRSVQSNVSATPRATAVARTMRPEPIPEEDDLMPSSSQLGSPDPERASVNRVGAQLPADSTQPPMEVEDIVPNSSVVVSPSRRMRNSATPQRSRLRSHDHNGSQTPRPRADAGPRGNTELDEEDLMPGSSVLGSPANGNGLDAAANLHDHYSEDDPALADDGQHVVGDDEGMDDPMPGSSILGSPTHSAANAVTATADKNQEDDDFELVAATVPGGVSTSRPSASPIKVPSARRPTQRPLVNHRKRRAETYEFAGPDSDESESLDEAAPTPARPPRPTPSGSTGRAPLREIARNSLGLSTSGLRASAGHGKYRPPGLLRSWRSPIPIDDDELQVVDDIALSDPTYRDEVQQPPPETPEPADPFLVDDDGSDLEPRATYAIPVKYKAPPSILHGKMNGQVSLYSRRAGVRKWSRAEELLLYRTVQKVPLDQPYPLRVVCYLHGEHGIMSRALEDFNAQHMKDKMKTVVQARINNRKPVVGRARFWLPPIRPKEEHPAKTDLKKELAEAAELAMEQTRAEIEAEHAAAGAERDRQARRKRASRAKRVKREATESDDLESIESPAESDELDESGHECQAGDDILISGQPDGGDEDEGEEELSDTPRRPRTRQRRPTRTKQILPVPETPPTGRRGRPTRISVQSPAVVAATSTSKSTGRGSRKSDASRRPARRQRLIPVVELPAPRSTRPDRSSRRAQSPGPESPANAVMDIDYDAHVHDHFDALQHRASSPQCERLKRPTGRSARRSLRSHRPPTPPSSISGISSDEDDNEAIDRDIDMFEVEAEVKEEPYEPVYEDLKEDDDPNELDPNDNNDTIDHDTTINVNDEESYDQNADYVRREQLKRRIYAGEDDDEIPRRR